MNTNRLWPTTVLIAATLMACGTATEETDMTTNVRRADDRVWIEGVEPWSMGQRGSSVHAAQAAIMAAVGEEVSYADLLGASGLAFRLQVEPGFCPSSPHSCCGEQCVAGAVRALPWQIRVYAVDPDDSAGVAEARQAVVASIDRGVPVRYGSEEDGVIVGYQSDGEEWLCLHPLKGDTMFVETDWPWHIAVFTAPKQAVPSRRELAVDALRKAVAMSRMERGPEGDYALGLHAWDVWLSKLDSLENADEEIRNSHMLGNAWIYGTLIEYRGVAAEYLRSVAGEFDDAAATHLRAAADSYDRLARELLADQERCVTATAPVPWLLVDGRTWTADMRADQMRRMRDALPLERQAIAELEAALASM